MNDLVLYIVPERAVASATPQPLPDPMKFQVSCHLMVEGRPMKGAAKQKQNETADMKMICEAVHSILMDPSNTLREVLLDTYALIVQDVSQSHLKVISKVKDEEMWMKVQGACDDRSLGSLFLQHVTAHLQKDLPYEIKVIPLFSHKDRASSASSAPSVVNAIEVNVIFDSIKKGEYTRYDLHQKLLSYQNKYNLHAIRSEEGFNPLHAIIVYDRLPLMLPLVQLKLFTSYLHETVPISSSSSFRGCTPLQITE